MVCKTTPSTQNKVIKLSTPLNDKIFVPPRDFINVYLNNISNQYGDLFKKKVFDWSCAGQKNHKLHI